MAHVQESQHYYTREGQPCYTVKSADGKKDITPDIRHVRKFGLLPGVTSVIKIMAAPGLERWKIRQGILAALTLPRIEGESEYDFLARVDEDAKAHAKSRAEEGTRIHAAIEQAFRGETYDTALHGYVTGVRKALTFYAPPDAQWQMERVATHPRGYGCKVDAYCEQAGITADFKTKEFLEDAKDGDLFYDEHIMQLAANKRAIGGKGPCLSVLVSVKVPGLVKTKEWPAEEEQRGLALFDACLDLWKLKHRHDSGWK